MAQTDALKSVMSSLDVVAEKEAFVKKNFEKKMLALRDELCEQMSLLTLQKEKIQNNAAEIVSACAIESVKPLSGKRLQRQLSQLTRAPAKPKTRRRKIVPYTQANLTDALVHIACTYYAKDQKTCSLRKAAELFMDGKYASLTRVWKSNRIAKVLEVLDESEGIEYVASIPKPKVIFFFYMFVLVACLLVCLLVHA